MLRIAALILLHRPVCYNPYLFRVARLGNGGDPHANHWANEKRTIHERLPVQAAGDDELPNPTPIPSQKCLALHQRRLGVAANTSDLSAQTAPFENLTASTSLVAGNALFELITKMRPIAS